MDTAGKVSVRCRFALTKSEDTSDAVVVTAMTAPGAKVSTQAPKSGSAISWEWSMATCRRPTFPPANAERASCSLS